MKPWQTLARVPTKEGALELRQRGDDEFLIVIAGRILMTSVERRSEEALAQLALSTMMELKKRKEPRVLVGGLGMGYTLRAALSALPRSAQVIVAELSPEVVDWCRGPLAGLSNNALADARTQVEVGDVSRIIADAKPGTYDAILLDLYEGPNGATQRRSNPFYGRSALLRAHTALSEQGVLAVWAEAPDFAFSERFTEAGFSVSRHRQGQGGRAHFVYLGVRESPSRRFATSRPRRAAGSRTSHRASPHPR